ncbi:MAG: hypothetical protein V4671_08455 [Armatimonadota bacterium]
MAVSPFTPAGGIDDNNDLLQSICRAFRTLPLDDRRRAIDLLQSDLSGADSAAVPNNSDRLPADNPAWDALDYFIREDSGKG